MEDDEFNCGHVELESFSKKPGGKLGVALGSFGSI